MKVNSVVALALLGLVSQTEAFNFGRILRTTANTMNSASTIVNSILGVYKDDGIVCPEEQFKARVVATGAFCQLENDNGAIAACQNFGQDCIAIPGRWGCGRLDNDPRRSCLFQPHKAPRGHKFPKIIFDSDDDDLSAYDRHGRNFLSWKPSPLSLESDEFTGTSDYYAKTLVADLEKASGTFELTIDEEEDDNGEPRSVILAVTAIVKALDLAGIRYPIGKTVCQVCKGTCNKIMSGENVNRCKYDACVKFLGGYKGSAAQPSCSTIPLP
ncbi:hypothetical protein B0O80DRAFT_285942 [Mortierella sp. GBAus27b]|nr:hypothetical protein B0O80DRAFT_285942 [Mortierella sp. GBAus27b]